MNTVEKLIVKAVFKGFFHAAVMPIIVALLTNFLFEGNWGGVAGLMYLFVPISAYSKLQDKDISKMVFKYTLFGIFGVAGFIAFLALMGVVASM